MMRNRLIVLIAAALATLGLVVPATAVAAAPAGRVVAATPAAEVVAGTPAAGVVEAAAAEGQAMLDDFLASVGAADESVQAATLTDWLVANLGVAVPLICSLVPEVLPSFAGIATTVCGLVVAVLPVVTSLLPVLLPVLGGVLVPLCDVVATFVPSFAGVLTLVCPFIANILAPPAP